MTGRRPDRSALWIDGESRPGGDSGAPWSDTSAPDARPGTEAATGHPFATDEQARYAAEGLLGRGGMGRVTLVRDRRLDRLVALKDVRSDTGDALVSDDRLSREALITAQLEHPGIVPVYDAGARPDGSLFYAMRLVRGRSLAEAIRTAGGLEERLSLLRHYLDVCEAVGYAHALGIVHRDLKPANVMVGEFGETQVVDWGLARPVADPEEDADWPRGALPDAARTALGEVVGTPIYMSPEQARGERVDARADVWSLGVTLLELLTGRPPVVDQATDAVLAALRSGETPPWLASPGRGAPRELGAIVAKAVATPPARRYPDAKALADDVARYLDGRATSAYRYSPMERLARWLSAYQLPVAVGVVGLALLTVVVTLAWRRTASERDRAVAAESVARDAEARATANLGRALVEQARVAADAEATPEAELLAASALVRGEDPRARGILAGLSGAARPRLASSLEAPSCAVSRLSEDGSRLLCLGDAVSLWATAGARELWRAPIRAEDGLYLAGADRVVVGVADHALAVLDGASGAVIEPARPSQAPRPFTMAARGRHAALVTGGVLEVHDVDGETSTLKWCVPKGLVAAALSGDDRLVALACSDGEVLVGPLEGSIERKTVVTPGAAGVVGAMAFMDGGRRLAFGTLDGEVGLIELAGGGVSRRVRGANRPVFEVRPSRDGRLLVVTGEQGGPQLWDAVTGAWFGRLPAASGHWARFVGDRELVTLGASLELWRLPARPAPPTRLVAPEGLAAAALSADGARVALARGDGVLSLRSTRDGATIADLSWQRGVVKDAAFSPSGGLLVATGVDARGVRVFDGRTGAPISTVDGADRLGDAIYRRVGVLRDDAVIAVPYARGVHLFSAGEVAASAEIIAASVDVFVDLGVAVGGAYAIGVTDTGGAIWRLTAADGERAARFELVVPDGRATSAAISADGLTVAAGGRRGVRVMRLGPAGPEVVVDLPRPEARVVDVALTAAGDLVADGEVDGSVRLWAVPAGTLLATMEGHRERVASVVFGADGRALLSASWDGTARSWDVAGVRRPASEVLEEARATWGLGLDDAWRPR